MRTAFSLVELSIVLVILGLLVGGVLTGQSLIRAAELRSVTTELQQFQTAVRTFQDRFFALPGDMRNAEDFWGTMSSGTCPNATGGTGTQTCNGNGDGSLVLSGAAAQTNETFTFWQHLANAGLIEGSFTGIAGASDTTHAVSGVNIPRARLNNAGWAVFYSPATSAGDTAAYTVPYLNHFRFGSLATGGTSQLAVLTTEEAWNIDTKIDDGLPAQGMAIGRFWNNVCATPVSGAASANNLNAVYHLSNTGIRCALFFRDLF